MLNKFGNCINKYYNKMKYNKFFIILTLVFSFASAMLFTSCDPDIKPGLVPEMIFPSDSLVVDLNELNQPALICVINSQTGLKSIELFVEMKSGQREKLDKTITNFYNPHAHSLNIKPVYSENMQKIIIEATDMAGQKTINELHLTVIPQYGLPEVHFSDGVNEITHIEYIEGDESPNVVAVVESEETINYLIFYQQKGLLTQMINDTVFFYGGEKQASVNLKTMGDGYNFERGLTALKVRVAVGARNKSREAVLDVSFRAAIKVHLAQNEENFNGLPKNGSIPFSGTLEVATSVQSLTYRLIARDGSLIAQDQNVSINANNAFSGTFTAHPTLDSVVFTATTIDGKTDELTVNVHVGYKIYHLMASLSGTTSANINTSPGCFFSAEKGRVYDYCGGRDNSAFVDIGFATWNSNRDIRMLRLDRPDKFRTLTTCSPNSYTDGAIRDWATVNLYNVATANIVYADFHKSTIVDIENSAVGENLSSGVFLVDNFASGPSGQTVGIYEAKINGQIKKVIVAFDKTESVNSAQLIYSTFWFYAKVQL